MDIFEKVFLGLIVFLVVLLISLISYSEITKSQESKNCLKLGGLLIKQIYSDEYYCAEVKRIKL